LNLEFEQIVASTNEDSFFLSFEGKEYLGVGSKYKFEINSTKDFLKLNAFLQAHSGDFIFCALNYDLKNIIFNLESSNSAIDEMPLALFVVPEKLHRSKKQNQDFHPTQALEKIKFEFPSQLDYLKNLEKIKNHIQYGDFYEVNYCINPSVKKEIDPLQTYQKLNQRNNAPFSGYFKYNKQHIICGSPERFLKKEGNKLTSQPIKGTIKRGNSEKEDELLKIQLKDDPKEKAENIMIVDLVRSDLSKIATLNSLNVEALNKVQTFNTVHQLVSTISCEIVPQTKFTDILKATFPMGSMTGAPKLRSMELMEKYEIFKRGMYSGSIGFIDEANNFDLNVVIRSILYNETTKVVNCPVGGAITFKSNPNNEYEECKLKANSMLQCILDGK